MIIINGGRGLVIDIISMDTRSDSPIVLFAILDDVSLKVNNFSFFDIQLEEDI